MERIEEYNQEPDRVVSKSCGSEARSKVVIARFQECSFAWPGQSIPVLRSIDLELTLGLTLVYGEIGSGKTGKADKMTLDRC